MLRLQKGLVDIGLDSRVLVAKKRSSNPDVEEWTGDMRPLVRAQRRIREEWLNWVEGRIEKKRPDGFDFFSDDRSRFGSQLLPSLEKANVVNLHWVARFVDVSRLFSRLNLPLVWTLHDQHSFTGGCHYDFGCERWREGCGRCPQIGSSRSPDFSSKAWSRKKDAYSRMGEKLTIVTPSKWLGKLASESPLLGEHRIEFIPYGVPTDVYHPRSRDGLRQAFALNENDRALLFVADRLANRRKGLEILSSALSKLPLRKGSRLVLFLIGSCGKQRTIGSHPVIHLGSMQREELMAAAYSAADFFIMPSLQDNLPNTVLESLACGTPVIGSDTGGIPEMVRSGETGWLFETGRPESLGKAIERAMTDGNLAEMRRRCRVEAETSYSMEAQASKYKRLYEELLEGE